MSSKQRPPPPHILVSILALAAAYFTTGLVERALPMHADYPTAVWPPAGIALAAVLMLGRGVWPGIFLGALLLNINISVEMDSALHVATSLALAVVIAVGATVQALAAGWLVRRFVGDASPLASTRGMILLPLLGGPVASVLSATVGTTALLELHFMDAVELPFAWFTWWVGDIIGVVTFTPLLLLLADPTLGGGPRRRLIVGVPLVAAFVVVLLGFQFASHLEEHSVRSDFERAAELATRVMEREFDEYLHALDEMQALFAVSGTVTAKQFDDFATPILRRYVGLRAVEWAPRVTPAERAAVAADLRAEGHEVSAIYRLDDGGRPVPVTGDEDSFPVRYVAGWGDNQAAYGYDLGSEPRRRRALERCVQDGTPHATGPLRLVQGLQTSLLVFHIVHEQGVPRGFVLMALQVDEMVRAWLRRANTTGMRVAVFDRGPRGDTRTLIYGEAYDDPRALRTEAQLVRAGRHWSLVFSTRSFEGHSLQAWSVLLGGMLFTGFLSMFMLVVSGQSAELEEAVAVRTAELGTLAQRLQRVLDSVGEGICGTDLADRTTFVNEAAARMTGHPASSLIGRDIHEVLHGPACQADTCAFQTCLHDDRFLTGIDHGMQRADGTKIAIEFVKAPVLEDGRVTGGVLAFKDITERLAVDRMKDEFISVVSHELRTPLTAIQGVLGLLHSGKAGPLSPPALRLTELGVRNSERLVALVNDILDIERLDSGLVVLERTPCDAAAACREVTETVRPVADRAGVQLVVECEPLEAWADPMRLAQVLTNIVGNAIKFSHPHGTIRLRGVAEGGFVRFEVADEGRGIPANKLEAIFDRFHQVDSSDSRERGGTGLGLAICKSIVTQHGGRIWVESDFGKGSTFKFTIPASAPT